MAGIVALLSQIPVVSISASTFSKNSRYTPYFLPQIELRNPGNRRNQGRSMMLFSGGNDDNSFGGLKEGANGAQNGTASGADDLKRNGRPVFNIRWRDLLDPDPDNILAVCLTGLLTWASVQVLWQLFFISIAIVVAALKYSFVAALLLFILITLL